MRGAAVRMAGGSHGVFRRADARRSPMARLGGDLVARLADTGFLVAEGDWLVWSGAPVPDGIGLAALTGGGTGARETPGADRRSR